MSPNPQLPALASRLTKKSPPPLTGVGQKSSAAEFTGAPHGSSVLSRWETQMSSRPCPPGRFEAMYRLSPSGDWIGQPSWNGVFSSELLPPISSIFWAVPQAEKFSACPTAVSAVRLMSAATSAIFIPFRIFAPFPTCSTLRLIAHVLVGAHDAKRVLSAGL